MAGEAEFRNLPCRTCAFDEFETKKRTEGADNRLGGPEAEHLGEVEFFDVGKIRPENFRRAEWVEVCKGSGEGHEDEVEELVMGLDATRAERLFPVHFRQI